MRNSNKMWEVKMGAFNYFRPDRSADSSRCISLDNGCYEAYKDEHVNRVYYMEYPNGCIADPNVNDEEIYQERSVVMICMYDCREGVSSLSKHVDSASRYRPLCMRIFLQRWWT